MSEKKKAKPPPGEYSAFKKLLGKLVRVPKNEIDEKEAEYKQQRPPSVGKRRKPA